MSAGARLGQRLARFYVSAVVGSASLRSVLRGRPVTAPARFVISTTAIGSCIALKHRSTLQGSALADFQSWRCYRLGLWQRACVGAGTRRYAAVTMASGGNGVERWPAMEAAQGAMFKPVPGGVPYAELPERATSKISIVGVGAVGMAIAQTVMTRHLADRISLVDVAEEKLEGEMMDLQHSAAFLPRTQISSSTDYSVTAGSDLCIITAGAAQKEGESRLDLVAKNVAIFKKIVPQLVESSPDALLLVVANPVDALTYVTWKLSGFPVNRVFGSGTNLDTSRLQFMLAEQLGLAARNVHGYIIGEHGDSSVPVWSGVTVGGVSLLEIMKQGGVHDPRAELDKVYQKVAGSAYDVLKLKGNTAWAIGHSVATLAASILEDQRHLHPVSTLAKGLHGIENDVFLSLPALLGRKGIMSLAYQPLAQAEVESLQASAKQLWEVQSNIEL